MSEKEEMWGINQFNAWNDREKSIKIDKISGFSSNLDEKERNDVNEKKVK